MRSLSRPLSRRSVQGMLAGAVVVPLAACDLLPEPEAAAPPAPTRDERLVERVTARIRTVRGLAAGVAWGGSLVATHDAHLAALGSSTASASPSTTPSSTPSTSPTAAATTAPPTAADVRSAEVALETALTAAASRAQDGGLARLLASMAASIAQHVAALPPKATR